MSQVSAGTMVEVMVRMQQQHNDEVHLAWRDQGFEYYRAIWVECAELLDHFGWKWWKKQATDVDQVKLEIVDIWHFGLSDLMRAQRLDESVSNRLAALSSGGRHDAEAFRQAVEALAQTTLTKQAFDLQPFLDVMVALPM
ncbi:MAG: dUTP diphosphatase, partial [Proteobacteria bacterium]|nr:dUTP diphosphatase [Pseudomonadota bacterium]